MARTIESPGVEIREVDLSLRTQTPVGTKVLLQGFAAQGPTNELIQVSTSDELNQIFFGNANPTNAAERYFYHSAKEVLNSPATLLVTRLPYGSADGTGFNGEYTALAYAATGNSTDFTTSSALQLMVPTVVKLTETQYDAIKAGQFTWSTAGWAGTAMNTVSDYSNLGNAAFFIVNDAKTTINETYEGYYMAVADNSTVMLSGYDSVSAVNTLNSGNTVRVLSNSLLGFYLTGTNTTNPGNISEIVENSNNFDFTNTYYNDSLIMYLFRLSTSVYANDPNKLYYTPVEKFVGSLEANDQRASSTTGQMETFYLGSKVNDTSNYVQMFVNPNIANYGIVESLRNTSNTLNPVGSYTPCKSPSSTLKDIGSIPSKVERALLLAENLQSLDVDIVLDGGLSTIWAYVQSAGGGNFDDTMNVATDMSGLANPTGGDASDFALDHRTVFNLFNQFCGSTRKDCLHISDPIRGIFVNGENSKILDSKSKNFTSNVYTPLKNLYASANSNYAATYANWISIFDNNSNKYVWLPFSGWQAAIIARMDAALQPWYAPMGLNNGLVRNVTDIAVRTTQKQQDMLYRIGINPVVFFQGDGFVVWGQKTLQSKPSAFDRINVRRLFFTMERATLKVLRYFVAEPNTVFTRTRVVNVLKPLFDLAKNNEGMYDYLIVCDERNNTPQVIDNNEMNVDIYIKPVRTAEFILATFYATRTDADFNELVG